MLFSEVKCALISSCPEEKRWLEDAKNEALWQMGEWQAVADPSSQQATTSSGFNASICACLKVWSRLSSDMVSGGFPSQF